MKSKWSMWVAGLAALLVGMPLAEQASASNGWNIASSAVSLAAAITSASVQAS